jgi:cation transport ATPase
MTGAAIPFAPRPISAYNQLAPSLIIRQTGHWMLANTTVIETCLLVPPSTQAAPTDHARTSHLMSDQTPFPVEENKSVSSASTTPPAAEQDWRDVRRAEREARREERRARRGSSGAWVGGVILIVLGVIFLLQNVGGFYLNNWWALFILIPAFGSFADAWNRYREAGRLNRRVRGALISGGVLLLVTATFLFNWNWGLVLPVLLIIWGVTILLNSLLPD